MSLKRIILLAVVVAALAFYYNIKEVKIAAKKKSAQELKAKIFPHPKDDIAQFKLVRKEGTFLVEKGENGWRLLEPLKDNGDQYALDNMAANLTNSITLRPILENPGKDVLPEYGLENPYIQAYVKLKKGGEEGPVLVGDISPLKGYVYIMRPGDKTIYLANSIFREGLDKTLYDMRDKIILRSDEKTLKEVEFSAAQGQVKVAKDDAGEWRITQPSEIAADQDAINNMVNALKASKIQKFIEEEPASLEPYGLKEPKYSYTFSPLQDGSTSTLLIGAPVKGEEMVYAKYQAYPKVFALKNDVLDKMPKSFFDFRRKRILTFSDKDIQKIEIEREGTTLVCEREEQDEWRITSPRNVKGDYYKVSGYLDNLLGLKATGFFPTEEKGAAQYGFSRPYLTVRLWPKNAQQPIILVVGEKAGSELGRYARVNMADELATVSEETIKKLVVELNDMRDRYLTSMDEKQVMKMVVELPGLSPLILTRKGKEEWRLMKPVETRVDSLRVTSLLWRLQALRFNDVISEQASEEAPYGFDRPNAKITLWGNDEKEPIDIVTLGKTAIQKDNIYVRVRSKAGVYTTDADLLDRIPKDIEELKRKL